MEVTIWRAKAAMGNKIDKRRRGRNHVGISWVGARCPLAFALPPSKPIRSDEAARSITARDIVVGEYSDLPHHRPHILSFVVVLCIHPLFIPPPLRPPHTLPIPPRIPRANSIRSCSPPRSNEVRQEPEQPDRGDAPRLARQVPVLQGPQEAAQADRRRLRFRRAAEQAPARRGRRPLLADGGDDPGGGRVRRPPRRRARQVQRLLPREGGGVRHPAEGAAGQGGERGEDGVGGGAPAGAEGDRRLARRDGAARELQRAQLHRTGQDPQEVRQEDRRADPSALHPERDAGALLHHRPPVQARQGVRGDAGPAPATEPAAAAGADERRREGGQRRWRRQARGQCRQLLAGQRRRRRAGAGGDRGHGVRVHEEHRGRAQVAQGDPERELDGERLLPAAVARRQRACGGAGAGGLS